MKVAVIGGGAAGFYSAIWVKEFHPNAKVTIFEKSKKLLAKVKISGGGRCNVTNGTTSIKELAEAYPRGSKKLRKAFGTFNNQHVIKWFEERHVPLTTQPDGCVFPVAQDSQVIIDCFLNEVKSKGIAIETSMPVTKLTPTDEGIKLEFANHSKTFDKVIVATGGAPKESQLNWLKEIGHKIVQPLPSLFTFNMPQEPITKLMGIVVENTQVSIQGTKLKSNGPLLITHWGMSGPAILKLSAFGARILAKNNYEFTVQVNWIDQKNEQLIYEEIYKISEEHSSKKLSNYRPYGLQDRLWRFLLEKVELNPDKKWMELGKKGINKIVQVLAHDCYEANGKTTFKEEFVTCGGISLDDINFKTMESKVVPNLHFTGEILDIDGITGGYNFQAAWTTAYFAAKGLC